MPKHCAALPGAANELLGSGTAELATALLERLGAVIPAQRDRGSRHAFVLHTPSYAPQPPATASRPPLAATALARATTARNGALARAAQAEQALRHRTPSRPTLTAMSVTAVTAVGAAAAITATGGFAAMSPSAIAQPAPIAATEALTLAGAPPAADAAPATGVAPAPVTAPVITAPIVTAPLANLPAAAADLPTVQVPKIVSEATATAKTLTAPARPAAAPRKAAVAAPAHAPAGGAAPARKATAGTGVGAAALKAGMTKIGKPYSWGAVGPNAFDCSGLMMWAFKQVGVTLPRTSAAQSTAGTAVSKADLRPGDLVFFYSPVSHVGIYLGNGKILNATQSGEPVQISNMAYMPFHNARRI